MLCHQHILWIIYVIRKIFFFFSFRFSTGNGAFKHTLQIVNFCSIPLKLAGDVTSSTFIIQKNSIRVWWYYVTAFFSRFFLHTLLHTRKNIFHVVIFFGQINGWLMQKNDSTAAGSPKNWWFNNTQFYAITFRSRYFFLLRRNHMKRKFRRNVCNQKRNSCSLWLQSFEQDFVSQHFLKFPIFPSPLII
jgi:hypothetical protein